MRDIAQTLLISVAAVLVSMLIFSTFLYFYSGVAPIELCKLMVEGSLGSAFSISNTLEKAAPLILTALCTALPFRVGLINIGAEGSLLLGGLAAVAVGLALPNTIPGISPLGGQFLMALAAMIAGGLLIALVGMLRQMRGVNETISSLLLFYIALKVFTFMVEGPMKDPASANKPSTYELPEEFWVGSIVPPEQEPEPSGDTPGGADSQTTAKKGFMTDVLEIFREVHWGLGLGVIFCVVIYLLMYHTTFGFAARMIGGNVRAAQASGLPVGWVMFLTCFLAGAAAGLAGMVEVAHGEHRANGALNADYGFTGILVAFMARHHPLAIIPVAVMFGGLGASSGLIQRRLDVPEASIQVFMGTLFMVILAFETFYGRLRIFLPRQLKEAPTP